LSYNVFEDTGLFEDDFEGIHTQVEKQLTTFGKSRTTKHILTSREMVFLTFFYLRHKPRYNVVADKFHISKATVHRVLYHTIPFLATSIKSIKWPDDWTQIAIGFNGAQFAVDGTAHYRDRVHPGQRLWYRGDKRSHFMGAQIVVTLTGRILSVHFLTGHNNDQGMFNRTIKSRVELENIIGLGDRGYSHALLVTPDDVDCSLQHLQAAFRAIVEIIVGMVKNWEYAAGKVSHPPEIQALGLKVVYEVTDMIVKQFPRAFTLCNNNKLLSNYICVLSKIKFETRQCLT